MTEACVVANCNTGHVPSDRLVALFNLPENPELRSKWIAAIPASSASGGCGALTTADAVCEKHFFESDVIRHYVVQDAAGNVVEKVAYDYPRLADSAVPSIFPGCELRVNGSAVENGQFPAQPPLQAPERSNANAAADALYNYMLIDTISDATAHALAGTAHAVVHLANHADPPKVVEPEVVNHVTSGVTETHPLLGGAEVASHDVTIPDVAIPAGNDVAGAAVTDATTTIDAFQAGGAPVITTEPVPIFVQPLSTVPLSENVADGGAADVAVDDGCCGDDCCGDDCCGDDCCGDCDVCADCGDCGGCDDCGSCGDCGDCIGCCVS